MSALLQIADLQLGLRAGGSAIVRGVSLEVGAGEKVALVGESGSGKSLTALSVLRLHDGRAISVRGGSIRFAGVELLDLAPRALRRLRGRDIAMIFQEPLSALNPAAKVGRQVMEPLRIHHHPAAGAAVERALTLLQRVGIDDPQRCFDAYPHALSGGQRQRAMIAMALACGPRLLLADEPTTALDVTTQMQILELLEGLAREHRMGLLLISHDLGLVRRVADRVYVMQRGLIVESGPTDSVLRTPRHPHTRALMAAEPLRAGLTFHPLPAVGAPTLLRTRSLDCRYRLPGGWPWQRRQLRAVAAVDLELREGETLGLVGESGSGKSTLARALVGLQGYSGELALFGQVLPGRFPIALRQHVQMVFQDPCSALSPRLSVASLIREGLLVHRPHGTPAEHLGAVERACTEVGLALDLLGRFPHELSGGQRQRVAIARSLVLRPRLLVLDEPTSALDCTVQAQLLSLLAQLQQASGMSYLLISHDLRVVRSMAHRVLVMRRGRIVECASAEEIFRTPRDPYTRKLVAAARFAAGEAR